jgi:amino acid adenylation domain-containing protein
VSLPTTLAGSSLEEKRALLGRLLRERRQCAGAFELVTEEDRARLPGGLDDAYPLTLLQRGMLFHSEYAPRAGLYHDVFRYTLRGRWDEAALAESCRRLTARHPVLRAAFDLGGFGEPLQLVHAAAGIPIEVHTLPAGASPAARQEALAAWRLAELRRGFEWARPPLLRLGVHREDDLFHLSLSFHHAILDGWSVALLIAELLTVYAALARGEDPPREPPPAAAFREYVALERQTCAAAETREALLAQLAGANRGTLPRWPSRARGGEAGAVETYVVELPAATVAGLPALARRLRVPVRTLLLAAHLRALAVFGGQRDAMTGLVLSGRPEGEGGDRVLGLFLNTMPLRASAGDTWAGLAQATFRREAELLPLRRYPLAEVQRLLGGEPLFETAFNFIHLHAYGQLAEVPGLEVLDARFDEATNFPLMVNLRQHAAGIGLDLVYAPAQLDGEQVRRLGGGFRRALAAMVADPEARCELRSLLGAGERQQLLVEANDTWALVLPVGVHQLFEAQAERRGSAAALVAGDRELSYDELEAAANRLAHHLRRQGVGREALVGIALERTHELLVAVLAVLKAGGAYVPLDPSYPPERLAFMAADARLQALVTRQHLLGRLPGAGTAVVALDRDAAAIAAEPATRPGATVLGADLAYVIYTSGSTGRPKGVQIPHAAVVSLLACMAGRLGAGPSDRLLAVTTLSFDISVLELLLPLAAGGTVVLGPSPGAGAVEETLGLLRGARITLMQATPSAWRLLLDAGWRGTAGLRALCGGEAMPADLPGRLLAACARLWNAYGPTETTIWSTCHEMAAGGEGAPIGRPLDNTVVYVSLSAGVEPAPAGTAGELLIGGAGVARGYLGRPELTAERFVPDPLSGVPGARLYRTGDLVRWLPDGELEFLARLDHQVKIRGFRIEPGEIEAVLARHEAVRECAVVARDAGGSDWRLVAWFVAEAGRQVGAEELRGFLRRELPDYMVPAAIVELAALPRTANGKLDRKALPGLDAAAAAPGAAYEAPRTPLEEQLAGLWAEVLKVGRVGIHDDFFAIGGHSLLATQLVFRLRQVFGLELPLRVLTDSPTIAELAYELARRQAGEQEAAEVAAVLAEIQGLSEDEVEALLHESPGIR